MYSSLARRHQARQIQMGDEEGLGASLLGHVRTGVIKEAFKPPCCRFIGVVRVSTKT